MLGGGSSGDAVNGVGMAVPTWPSLQLRHGAICMSSSPSLFPSRPEKSCLQEDPASLSLPHLLHHTPQLRGVDGHHPHLLLRV